MRIRCRTGNRIMRPQVVRETECKGSALSPDNRDRLLSKQITKIGPRIVLWRAVGEHDIDRMRFQLGEEVAHGARADDQLTSARPGGLGTQLIAESVVNAPTGTPAADPPARFHRAHWLVSAWKTVSA